MTLDSLTKTDCVGAATKILGDKWTPVLLYTIHHDGQAGFCQLQNEAGGINPRTLSARLSRLEEQGILVKCSRDSAKDGQSNASRRECYRLSEKGEALMPVLEHMVSWGKRFGPDDFGTAGFVRDTV